MKRQSISFTDPNEDWLNEQIKSKEYTTKSELINDLIRQARDQQRQLDFVRSRLETSENSGYSKNTKEEILAKAKSLFNE